MGKKWILRFKGEAAEVNGAELLRVLESHSIKVLDNSLPKLLMVSGTGEAINSARGEIDSRWTIAPERSAYPVPDTKKKLK